MSFPERTRPIVVPLPDGGDGRVVLCRMSPDRGVFPGQWALPGGGASRGNASRTRFAERLGIQLRSVVPLFFKDAVLEKTFSDGSKALLHIVFLVYRCAPASLPIRLNEGFSDFLWAGPSDLPDLLLDPVTRETLMRAAYLADSGQPGDVPDPSQRPAP